MKDVTGYNLKDLNVLDGKFVTEEGIDLLEIYAKKIKEGTRVPEQFKDIAISSYGEDLSKLAKNGFNSVPDLILSIDYEMVLLWCGQSENFGAGKTQWIDKLEASKQQNFIYA